MSHQLPLEHGSPVPSEGLPYDLRTGALRRRRVEAARVRRRRMLLADIAAGALLALAGIVLAPGLAILALAALLALGGCCAWVLGERVHARRTDSAGSRR